ncbi:hypothetical protein ACFL2H_10195 [Planctomycetota bacterium]
MNLRRGREILRQNSIKKVHASLEEFHKTYQNGAYYEDFLREVADLKARGVI